MPAEHSLPGGDMYFLQKQHGAGATSKLKQQAAGAGVRQLLASGAKHSSFLRTAATAWDKPRATNTSWQRRLWEAKPTSLTEASLCSSLKFRRELLNAAGKGKNKKPGLSTPHPSPAMSQSCSRTRVLLSQLMTLSAKSTPMVAR